MVRYKKEKRKNFFFINTIFKISTTTKTCFIFLLYYFYLCIADVYDKVQEEMTLLGLDTECLGGGRILHEPDKKSIEVFGYSQVQYSYELFIPFGKLDTPFRMFCPSYTNTYRIYKKGFLRFFFLLLIY